MATMPRQFGWIQRQIAAEAEAGERRYEESRREMTVKCAWHQKFFGCEKILKQGTPGTPVSHGICQKCAERALSDAGIVRPIAVEPEDDEQEDGLSVSEMTRQMLEDDHFGRRIS